MVAARLRMEPSMALSDTQLVVLSAACQRPHANVYPLPLKLPGGAAAKVLASLLKKGLIEEVEAKREDTVWREHRTRRHLTLRATKAASRRSALSRQASLVRRMRAAKEATIWSDRRHARPRASMRMTPRALLLHERRPSKPAPPTTWLTRPRRVPKRQRQRERKKPKTGRVPRAACAPTASRPSSSRCSNAPRARPSRRSPRLSLGSRTRCAGRLPARSRGSSASTLRRKKITSADGSTALSNERSPHS